MKIQKEKNMYIKNCRIISIVLIVAILLTGCANPFPGGGSGDGECYMYVETSYGGMDVGGNPLESGSFITEFAVSKKDSFRENENAGKWLQNSKDKRYLMICKIKQIKDDMVSFTSSDIEYEVSMGAKTKIHSNWYVDDGLEYSYEIWFSKEKLDLDAYEEEAKLKEKEKVSLEPAIEATLSEACAVNYELYEDPSGYFTAEIPAGWLVYVGFPGGLPYDLISFPITVYDPYHPERKVYFCTNCVTASSSFYQDVYANSYTGQMMVLSDCETGTFFKEYGEYLKETDWGYTDFNLIDYIGDYYYGDSITAEAYSPNFGKEIEAIFAQGGFQEIEPLQSVLVYDVTMLTAAKEDFVDWEPVLMHILGSLNFTDSYNDERAILWSQVLGTAAELSAIADSETAMLSAAWEERNTAYDIISQKNSDATLGYERVYDVETGDRYKAYNGFLADYDGERYKPVTDDMYALPITGYIE